LKREDVVLASNSVVDVRRSPSHAAELVTQVIYGDRVAPLKAEGDWVLVRLDDFYIGWVRSWHLKWLSREAYDAFDRGAGHRVESNLVQIYESPDESSLPVTDAVVGTPVVLTPSDRRGWRRLALPDGRSGFAHSKDFTRRRVPRRILPGSLEKVGLRFLGIPYTWGGTTPKGFDCSGLVQRILRLHGIVIPRDSDQQALIGRSKPTGRIDDLRTGDLLFFGKPDQKIHHVAMYLHEGLFLHARGEVRVNALVESHPLFDRALLAEWRTTRDVLTK
jgi:SH3-like domain-containing protein